MLKSLAIASLFVCTTALAQGAPAKPAEPAKKDAAPAAKPADPAKPADGKGAPATPATPATPAAAPAAAAPAGPPPPAAELAANLKGMEGKWKCDGNVPDSPFAKAHKVKATITWKSDLGGYWYSMRYEEAKAKDNPTPYLMASMVGWDPSKKQLVRADNDNFGAITHMTSPGWTGDTFVWSGEIIGQKTKITDTISKGKTAKDMTSKVEMVGPDGKPMVIAELTCKK